MHDGTNTYNAGPRRGPRPQEAEHYGRHDFAVGRQRRGQQWLHGDP